ncbi:hypothetical protein [Actinomadura alba]|uniref:PH domain-containing protein n=1 Tax=Actinomadura alba TaxID=406431 RepID=A0ABR7LXA6_9ACTN|nr:hypothetical protein [Actinomadura alba]MBC6469404.1 hypothetical protein [Actinomadura alba]
MVKIARAALFTVLPAELLLMVMLVSGVSPPDPVVVAVETAVVLVFILVAASAYRLSRAERLRGEERRAALRATVHRLVPVHLRKLIEFELKGTASIFLWGTRRRNGVPPGATAVSYSKEQTPTLMVMLFLMGVEAVAVDLLLKGLNAPDGLRVPVLVIDIYGIVWGLALGASCVTRPHVVTHEELRIRYGAYFDLRTPREQISSVRLSRDYNGNMVRVADGRLSVAMSSQTNLVVELTEPIGVVRPLGRRAEVTTIRFFADTPNAVLNALQPPRSAVAA